jgi:nitrite reductase/ring-hydroxylating ferredoxin subunit
MTLSRRETLERAWKAGGLLLAGSAIWTTAEALRPLAVGTEGGLLPLAGGFSDGSATFVRQGRFWVSNVRGRLFALSQVCPHLGCRVPFCESSGQFECPCHGSVFNLAGEWLAGPSPRGLDRYEVVEVHGQPMVDLRRVIRGPAHGVREHDLPARGPGCDTGTGTGTAQSAAAASSDPGASA